MLTKYEIEEEELKPKIKKPEPEIRIDANNITLHGLGINTNLNEQGFTITRTVIPNPVYVDYFGVHDQPLQYHVEPITWDATMAQDEVQVTHASGTMNLVEEPFIAHETGEEIVVPNMNLLQNAIFPDPGPPQSISMEGVTDYIPYEAPPPEMQTWFEEPIPF